MGDKNDENEKSEWSFEDHDEDQKSGLTEMVKKVLAIGIGAAFLTEESIRNTVKDFKLPKEIITGLLQGAAKSKDEITSRVSNEVIKIIQKIDFVKEASRFVENHKFKISAEIDIQKK